MSNPCKQLYIFTLLVFLLAGCVPSLSPSAYPNPTTPTTPPTYIPLPEVILLMLTPWATTTPKPSPYPTIDYTNVPPDFFFTPTSDPYGHTISADIKPGYSQEEIAKILFSKWLDHFMQEDISPVKRLEGYSITTIEVPKNQGCADVFWGDFYVNVSFILNTTLPIATTGEGHTDWVSGDGNILGPNEITKSRSGIIYQTGNTYMLEVIPLSPTC